MAYAALGGLKHFFKSNAEAIDISNATFTFAKFVLFNYTPAIDSTAVSIFVVVLVELTNTEYYKWKCPSQRLKIDWNEQKTISDVNLLIWEGYFTKRMRLRALLFELWPFENSTGPCEG